MNPNRKISDHYHRADFACRCGKCYDEFKISLGIVGILESIYEKYKGNIEIISAYRCKQMIDKQDSYKKSYHAMGKAVDIKLKQGNSAELFRIMETYSEIHGIGYYPEGDYIHIDIREKDRAVWIYEDQQYKDLTPAKREKYGL